MLKFISTSDGASCQILHLFFVRNILVIELLVLVGTLVTR